MPDAKIYCHAGSTLSRFSKLASGLLCHKVLPAGMLARQLLRTFKADSDTAAGVSTSSHAGEKKKKNNVLLKCGLGKKANQNALKHALSIVCVCVFLRSVLLAVVPLKEREIDFLDSSSAGVCSSGAEPTTGAIGGGTWAAEK